MGKGYLEVFRALGRGIWSVVTLDAFLPEEQSKPKDSRMQGADAPTLLQRNYEAMRTGEIDPLYKRVPRDRF